LNSIEIAVSDVALECEDNACVKQCKPLFEFEAQLYLCFKSCVVSLQLFWFSHIGL